MCGAFFVVAISDPVDFMHKGADLATGEEGCGI